ncbi:hypothetical protein [Salinisphaera sp. T31B1]|uniref:hypothetical protein n=1 Tax=Salinisphaera sp. T31B1 TaxID=727963 RepID=UPI00333E9DC8
MAKTTAIRLTHPAAARLRDDILAERRALSRALSIEADWRFHDGPEWASRYWAAFGDLQPGAVARADHEVAEQLAERAGWPVLTGGEAADARAMFRGLLALMHPQVRPEAAYDMRAQQWPMVLRAYRAGDVVALRDCLARTQGLTATPDQGADIRRLRVELQRLVQARAAVDRRLAELSQRFPYCLRDRLADADWIRRQRLALRQIRVMTAPPGTPLPAHGHPRKQVS